MLSSKAASCTEFLGIVGRDVIDSRQVDAPLNKTLSIVASITHIENLNSTEEGF